MWTWWFLALGCSGPSNDDGTDGAVPTTTTDETGSETGLAGDDDDDDDSHTGSTASTGDTAAPFELSEQTSLVELVCPESDTNLRVEVQARQAGGPTWTQDVTLTDASCLPGVLTADEIAAARSAQEASCVAAGMPAAFCLDASLDVSDWLETYNGMPGMLEFQVFREGPWELDGIPDGAVPGVGWNVRFFIVLEVGNEWWVTSMRPWGQRYNYVSPEGLITAQGSRNVDKLRYAPLPVTRATCTAQTDNQIEGELWSATRGEILYHRPTLLDCTWTDGALDVELYVKLTYTSRLHDDVE